MLSVSGLGEACAAASTSSAHAQRLDRQLRMRHARSLSPAHPEASVSSIDFLLLG